MTPASQIPLKVKEVVKQHVKTMKVLLVDDMELNNMNNAMILTRIGFSRSNITSAEDGIEAYKKVNAAPPDLILTDWNMPRADGLKLVQTLRIFPKYKNTMIIMITAEPDKMRKDVDQYINGFLKKPYSFADVEDMVYSVVARKMMNQ